MKFHTNERGLAGAILGMVAILLIGSFLYIMLNPAASAIFDFASASTTNPKAQDAIEQRETIWGYILFIPLMLGMLYIIGRGVLESRRVG